MVLFPLLKRMGFDPKHVINVGANHGHWTRQAIEYFPNASYTLLEPQLELRQHIQDLVERGFKLDWIHAGAGDAPGMLPFYVATRDDSSSFLQKQSGTVAQTMVQLRTLNEIVETLQKPTPDMVKIDAEGMDLKVLRGASNFFGKTDIFLVEALVCCLEYENSVLEVVNFMANAGYRLIDITELNRSPKDNALWLCELAFLRTSSSLLKSVTAYA